MTQIVLSATPLVRIEVYPSSLSLSISSILTVSRNVPFPGNVQFHG